MEIGDRKILLQTPLFSNISEEELAPLLEKVHFETHFFSQSEEIYLQKEGKNRIGILLNGTLSVFASKEKKVILNHLSPGSLFGVSALYGEKGADTVLIGNEEGKICFFEVDHMEIFWENAILRTNLISFLANRIRFLNQKILTLSAGNATGKLYRYLMQKADTTGKFIITSSLSEIANALNMGRASLYRALENLEKDGTIKRNGKEFIFINYDQNQ